MAGSRARSKGRQKGHEPGRGGTALWTGTDSSSDWSLRSSLFTKNSSVQEPIDALPVSRRDVTVRSQSLVFAARSRFAMARQAVGLTVNTITRVSVIDSQTDFQFLLLQLLLLAQALQMRCRFGHEPVERVQHLGRQTTISRFQPDEL